MSDYITQRALAQLHRQRYNADSAAQAEQADTAGQYNLAMFRPSTQARITNNNAESQADFNPSWDAFFQSVQGDDERMPLLGGQLGNESQFGTLAGLKKATKR